MIKKYWEFISESLKDDIDEGKLWILDEDDIREFLIDLQDENYLITITFGFVEEFELYNYSNKKITIKESFTEKVIPGDDIRLAYYIRIEDSKKSSDIDVTDSVIFAHDIIKDKIGGEIIIEDEDGYRLDLNNIKLKDGLWVKDEDKVTSSEYISLFIKQKNTVNFTQKQVADYYGLEYDKEDVSGKVYIHVDLEDMADCLLDNNDDYKDTLVGGMEHMWEYYESHYYLPETISFFQYSLDKENEVLMVKSIIKEMGGLGELLTEIHFDSNKSEDEVIEFLLKERFYHKLNELSKESEIVQEAKQIVGDWEMSSHINDIYDSILSEFDEKVDEEFNYKKVDIDSWVKSEHSSVGGYTQSRI